MAVALVAIVVLVGQVAPVSGAFIDVTRPTDPIARVDGLNQGDGDAGPPPATETVDHAIDDVGQKYLNFLDLDSGFAVTPSASGGLPVVGIRLYTANDVPTRDPASFQLAGSNGDLANGPWEVIASGNLALPDGRNDGGNAVSIPPTGNLAAAHQEVLFDNDTVWEHYRIKFPTLKDAADANSMQIGEVELLAVPEPAALALLAIGGLVMLVGRRRQG
jgi:hypothetical protein